MSLIIGVSGKKQSGKNTISKVLCEHFDSIGISCSEASFADVLKKNVCMDILGLSYNILFYGSDEEKNQITQYKWENLPNQIRYDNSKKPINEHNQDYISGYMTIREIMQVVGTDIFRKFFGEDIWVKAFFRNIPDTSIVLVTDVRFIKEAESILDHNGHIIRLTRSIYKNDTHVSEIELDTFDFKNTERCHIFDNKNMNTDTQAEEILKLVKKITEDKYVN